MIIFHRVFIFIITPFEHLVCCNQPQKSTVQREHLKGWGGDKKHECPEWSVKCTMLWSSRFGLIGRANANRPMICLFFMFIVVIFVPREGEVGCMVLSEERVDLKNGMQWNCQGWEVQRNQLALSKDRGGVWDTGGAFSGESHQKTGVIREWHLLKSLCLLGIDFDWVLLATGLT